ncbi:hypothetical protein DNTS_035396 [Danionella cerebrum]|uniref:AT-rich interactive domain-containing protein 5B n=1 Tax=Danionella cerebrum TaxID=2873325 RepID=A0A553NWA8_9TELE|nr:hypothetical protein DNTS_035396 [Danionella translucida]
MPSRLILPYERFTKGEEDKPLPTNKPRKQEVSAQESVLKAKMAALKPQKDEQKPQQSESEASDKVLELGVEDKEEFPEMQNNQRFPSSTKNDRQASSPLDEDEDVLLIKDEDEPVLQNAFENANTGASSHGKDASAAKSEDCEMFPIAVVPLNNAPSIPDPHTMDHWKLGILEYKVPQGVLANIEQSRQKEGSNQVLMVLPTLKQTPDTSPERPSERAEASQNEEPCFSLNPVLYPRGNPGIMSPLAKKKMLSQVNGTGLINSYPYGPPPPLVSRRLSEGSSAAQLSSQAPVAENNIVIKRPSVIQHAQSFKSRGSEDRRSSTEGSLKEICADGDPVHSALVRESYLKRSDPQSSMEKSVNMPRPGQAPSFLSDFYSSPLLHNLCRQTEHHLTKEHISKYLGRDVYIQDCETAQGFPDSLGLKYSTLHSQKDKGPPAERIVEEQPTDLSLPKPSPQKLPLSGIQHGTIQQDIKNSPLFQSGSSQASSMDYHPRACRVPPMTVSSSKKVSEPHSKAPNGRGEESLGYKLDEMSRPILISRSSPQTICTTRPLKRSIEELETGTSEKKIRAVTPLHCSTQRDVPGKPRTPEIDSESTKLAEPAHAVHVNGYTSDGHKIPLHSHLFQGLYPGTFVSQVQDMCESLGSHVTPTYSHPLQYLKNQAVLSPLMPPFAIHSLMMQRQFLATNPTHMYRHQLGTSYGDILHPGLYPISALHPQPAFSPPQLSSVHPSTKLS